MSIGDLISDRRKQNGMTIDDLAEKSGVPKGTLNKITNGVTKSPSVESIKAIAKALGCTLDDLNDGDPPNGCRPAEAALIRKYRAISDHGRETVNVILDLEYNRAEKEKRRGLEKGEETLSISANTKEA